MANFCGHCGAANEGGASCGSCGRPREVDPAAPSHEHSPHEADVTVVPSSGPPAPPGPPASVPMPPPMPPPVSAQQPNPTAQFPPAPQGPPPGYPPQGGYAPPGYGQPAAPKVNPFLGWPVGDYVRDAAAAFFLFATLGMPWQLSDDEFPWAKGGNVWWVIIAVLVAIVSLAVPYVAKARVIPSWTPQHYRLLKLGLNAPLAVSVLAAVVVELVNVTDDTAGALGSGVAMALAGIAMAVQPRQAEEAPGNADDRLWNPVARYTALAAVGLTVVLFALWFLHGIVSDDADIFDPVLGFVLVLVSSLVMPLAVVGWPAYAMTFGGPSAAWRRVFATSGFTVLVIALFALGSDYSGLFLWPPLEKWYGLGTLPGGGLLLLGAAAALAVSRAQGRQTTHLVDPVESWVQTVGAALLVAAAGCGVYALSVLLDMLAREEFEVAPIIVLVLAGAAAGGAVFARTLLADPRKNRIVVLGVVGGVMVLGFVVMLVVNGEDIGQGDGWFANNGWVVAAFFALPGLAAYALTVPSQVRSSFGPLVASGAPGGHPPQQYGGPGLPQQGYPQPGYPPQGPPPGYPQGPPAGPPQGYPPLPPPSGPPAAPPPGAWGPPPAP